MGRRPQPATVRITDEQEARTVTKREVQIMVTELASGQTGRARWQMGQERWQTAAARAHRRMHGYRAVPALGEYIADYWVGQFGSPSPSGGSSLGNLHRVEAESEVVLRDHRDDEEAEYR